MGGRRRNNGGPSCHASRKFRPLSSDPDADHGQNCWPSRPSCRRRSTAGNGWDLQAQPSIYRHGRAALPAGRMPDVSQAVGVARRRRVGALPGCCSANPRTCLLLDEPTNHSRRRNRWPGWEPHLAEFPGTVGGDHPRSLFSSRNAANWILELDRGRRHSLGRQLHLLAEAEGQAPRPSKRRPPTHGAATMQARAGMDGPERPQAPPHQEQGPASAA